jgi:colicin import membrane protein
MNTATFETDADKWRALAFALLLHAFVLVAMFAGLLWQRQPPPVASAEGEIEASLITSPQAAAAVSKAMRAAEQAQRDATPPPQPLPEPAPQTAQVPLQMKPQQALDQPDKVDQQRVSALALQAAEQQQKEQEERHRQAQILLQQQAQAEAENRQRLAAQEKLRQDQIAAIQRERAKAERDVKLNEQKLRQLQDQQAQLANATVSAPVGPVRPPIGTKGDDLAGLRARYIAAMNRTANANWDPVGVPAGVRCTVSFKQMPGGDVYKIIYLNCAFDAVARESIERALHKEPMPYTEFSKVFEPQPTITFCNPPEACAK